MNTNMRPFTSFTSNLRMLNLLKPTNSLAYPASCQLALRGPKKKGKGGGATEGPISTDIVNIWKDRKDPLVYPSDMYPPYVMGLLDKKYTPDDIMMQMYRGERIPNETEQWMLANAVIREKNKYRQKVYKRDWLYESEDDEGEDLGGVAGKQDVENAASSDDSDDD